MRESRDALDSAWASFHDAQRRRHNTHNLVRALWGQRSLGDDDFENRLGDATGRTT